MSILNVLLSADHLAVTVDTLAQDAQTGAHSEGAKLLLLPQHNAVLATRGSAQFFLRIYELCLQASFRADFTIERLSGELGGVIDRLWPNYVSAAAAWHTHQRYAHRVGFGRLVGARPAHGCHRLCKVRRWPSRRGPSAGGRLGVARRALAESASRHGTGGVDGSRTLASRLPQRRQRAAISGRSSVGSNSLKGPSNRSRSGRSLGAGQSVDLLGHGPQSMTQAKQKVRIGALAGEAHGCRRSWASGGPMQGAPRWDWQNWPPKP